jgi:hypothetical protein
LSPWWRPSGFRLRLSVSFPSEAALGMRIFGRSQRWQKHQATVAVCVHLSMGTLLEKGLVTISLAEEYLEVLRHCYNSGAPWEPCAIAIFFLITPYPQAYQWWRTMAWCATAIWDSSGAPCHRAPLVSLGMGLKMGKIWPPLSNGAPLVRGPKFCPHPPPSGSPF